MSADWFCKIGEKRIGPLSGQQLKTIVAKGQLKPEHLVRRGSEGPWVPAGRIKGLFPESPAGTARPLGKTQPQATAKSSSKAARKPGSPPTAKPTSLPTAAEAPTPPAAATPQESSGGHHKHHVQMNLDLLNIEAAPVTVSHRKVKAGLQGMKKDERKKLTILLLCLIGSGMTIGLIVLTWFFINSGKSPSSDSAKDKNPILTGKATDSGKKAEDKPVDKKLALEKPAQEKEPVNWKSLGIKILVDKVEVNALKPTRGAPPEGAKTEETYVLIVPVTLELKSDKVKQVEFTSWADDSLKKKVSLKDDQDKSYDLLEQVADKESDGKAITKTRIKVHLIFQAPTSKKLKFLHLALPVSAFHAEGVMIGYEIKPTDIQSAPAGKADKPAKTDEDDAAESTPKNDKKKPGKADKPAKNDEDDAAESTPKNDKKKPGKADKPAKTDEDDAAESTPKSDKKKPGKADKPAKTDEDDNVMSKDP
ncbi:MAG: GYF domain-containing protein [Planctomycetota bacterium]